jgi:ubiquinone/menaquinone biosynthesis C-methylase UbiE
MANQVQFGLGKGKVFPHEKAGSLLNPVRRLIQSPAAVARWIGLRGDETVLELGCGPGYFSIALRDATPHGRLVLFDLQPEMLRMARERVGRSGAVTTIAGNAMTLPFPAEAFDVVFIAAVLGEVPDRERCLEEVRRVLRPGGRLVVNEVRGDPDYIKARDLDRMCAGARLVLRRRRKGRVRWTCLSEYAPA